MFYRMERSARTRGRFALVAVTAGIIAFSSACGGDDAIIDPTPEGLSVGDTLITTISGGLFRSFIVHRPPNHDPAEPAPLLIVFHGATITALDMKQLIGIDEVTDAVGFVTVYPDGINRGWAVGCGCTVPDVIGINDLEFAAKIVEVMAGSYGIDSTRVYASGLSQGGRMAQYLACKRSGLIAGVASVAATTPTELAERCLTSAMKPTPIVFFLGTEDMFFVWDGNPGVLLSAPQTIDTWREINACSELVEEGVEPDRVDDGTIVRTEKYTDCDSGVEVVLYAVEGGGHTWPDQALELSPSLGRVTRDISAAEVMVDFLLRFQRTN